MADLTISAASVALVSGPKHGDQLAGEAFAAGSVIYRKSTDKRWYKAQSDGTADEAGATELGLALATADAAAALISVAAPGAVVSIGTGAAGSVYVVSATAGKLAPVADVVSTNKVTVAAVGVGSSKVRLARIYDAGAIAP